MTTDQILETPAGQILDSAIAMEVYGYEYLEIGYWQTNALPESSTAVRQQELYDWLHSASILEQTGHSIGEYWIMVESDLALCMEDLHPSQNVRDAWALWEYCRKEYGEDQFARALLPALRIRDCNYSTRGAVALVVRSLTPLAIAHAALIAQSYAQAALSTLPNL